MQRGGVALSESVGIFEVSRVSTTGCDGQTYFREGRFPTLFHVVQITDESREALAAAGKIIDVALIRRQQEIEMRRALGACACTEMPRSAAAAES